MLMSNRLDPNWVRQIKQEHKRLQADEDVMHNQELHRRILATWKETNPELLASLQREGMADALAYVLQQRMWTEQDELMAAGLPVTDAREQAERNNLMLDPSAAA